MATVKIGDRLQPYGVTLVASRMVNRDFKVRWFAVRAAEMGVERGLMLGGLPHWPLEYEALVVGRILDEVQDEWNKDFPSYVVPFGDDGWDLVASR